MSYRNYIPIRLFIQFLNDWEIDTEKIMAEDQVSLPVLVLKLFFQFPNAKILLLVCVQSL